MYCFGGLLTHTDEHGNEVPDTMGRHGMPRDVTGCHGCHGMPRVPLGAMGCHGVPWGAMGNHGVPWGAMGCHGLSWGAMALLRSSLIKPQPEPVSSMGMKTSLDAL